MSYQQSRVKLWMAFLNAMDAEPNRFLPIEEITVVVNPNNVRLIVNYDNNGKASSWEHMLDADGVATTLAKFVSDGNNSS